MHICHHLFIFFLRKERREEMEGGVKKREREDSRQAHRLGQHGSHDLWALRALPGTHPP